MLVGSANFPWIGALSKGSESHLWHAGKSQHLSGFLTRSLNVAVTHFRARTIDADDRAMGRSGRANHAITPSRASGKYIAGDRPLLPTRPYSEHSSRQAAGEGEGDGEGERRYA